ncbi:MAG: hypothetical protein NZT92_10535 [Abditibacteriales bacterium]|nr:hypothetical protein [Abditibacteriales bacterium]
MVGNTGRNFEEAHRGETAESQSFRVVSFRVIVGGVGAEVGRGKWTGHHRAATRAVVAAGGGDALPFEQWVAVMKEEIDWLKKAGATRIRYWSGGNLYPNVLEAASRATLRHLLFQQGKKAIGSSQRHGNAKFGFFICQ